MGEAQVFQISVLLTKEAHYVVYPHACCLLILVPVGPDCVSSPATQSQQDQ